MAVVRASPAVGRHVDPAAAWALGEIDAHGRVVVIPPEADGQAVPRPSAIAGMKRDEAAHTLRWERHLLPEHRYERLAVGGQRDPRIGAPRRAEVMARPRST